MFPSSLAVVGVGVLLGIIALGAFAWAWRRGHFDRLDRQAHIIFDERDMRLERPWESERQRARREARYGPLIEPSPGEWGGG